MPNPINPLHRALRVGFAAAALFVGGSAAAGPIATPEPGEGELLLLAVAHIDDGPPQPAVAIVPPGAEHAFEFDQGDEHWRVLITVLALPEGTYQLVGLIERNGTRVAEPQLAFGEAGATLAWGTQEGARFDGIEMELRARLGEAPADGPAEEDDAASEDTADGIADEPPTPLHRVAPEYPDAALELGESGVVVLVVTVDEHGGVVDATYDAESSVPESSSLVASARDAVMQWRFAPAREAGEPVVSTVRVPVRFADPDAGG